ncbi:MAG TPA: Hsp20/alpha crystallin family protein [Chthoniobacterales bacterium]|nr:Hsp20/alpha crystallin family protein [Verrucomicrobiota bacterium]HTD14027.1 Hsp20/alpha crystallin family protein [Chthoniobacterales bacterium]
MNIASQEHQKSGQQSTEQTAYVTPNVDIQAAESGYVLYAEMPGVNRDGIRITVEDGNLVLVGHRQPLSASGEALHRETRQLSYRRVYELDPSIDANRISARIDQGILTVNLPKAENLKPRRITLE